MDMKRIVAVWLAAALCVALVGGAVLAEGQDDMPVELELDAPALSDAPETDDAGMDLDLDIAPLDGFQPEPVEAPVSNDPGDGEDVSNKIVVKKYITYEIAGGQATAITADRSLTEANIMDEVNGYPVTAIAPNAFQGFTKLWTVTVRRAWRPSAPAPSLTAPSCPTSSCPRGCPRSARACSKTAR